MRVAILNDNVMADLKADPVSVVVAGFDIPNCVAVAVLQKNAATIVPIQVGIVFPITVECQILDEHVRRTLAGEQWKD